MPRVSVIVPCYNHGQFLDEAVASVLAQTYVDYEIVIVNDGSTEEETVTLLQNYHQPKTRVIHTSNQGLAAARNKGIEESSGVYILPLDADDRICPTYMEKAVSVLDEKDDVGIVYCEAMFFGEKTGKWELPRYEFSQFLLTNLIFASAFFRKSDWAKTGGYNPNMIYGWEDYDFWLSLIELGREVYQIPEVLFHYRHRSDSMVNAIAREQQIYSSSQIFKNHRDLYTENIRVVFEDFARLREEKEHWHRETLVAQSQLESLNSRVLFAASKKTYSFLSRFPRLEKFFRSLARATRRTYR